MCDKECCDNCKSCNRMKGSFMGQTDYWCHKSNGQKKASHWCPMYEREA